MFHLALLIASTLIAAEPESRAWPPVLQGAKEGTVVLQTDQFLQVPNSTKEMMKEEGTVPFVVATATPRVELAYHRDLGPDAVSRRLWSSWGDIGLASDGRVYVGIGDHGNAVGGDARCFIYCWDPKRHVLEKIVDMNEIIPPKPGQPAWSKVHAKIDEGADGKIYFNCTLNDGNRASKPEYGWTKELPGGQIYQYDPATGETMAYASLPPKRCSATSILDRDRNIWWCNLEAGEGNALWGFDLTNKKEIFKSDDGAVAFNRNFALAADGSIYFNGEEAILHCDPKAKTIAPMKSSFPNTVGMRCSTRESKDGWIYGCTHRTSELFRYSPKKDKLEMLGINWLTGQYTTVMELSPDEKYLYYLPGAHGKAWTYGTPVIQYEIASGQRKVLAFLAEPFNEQYDFIPGGTYGVKVSDDGGTIYVNFNGHASDKTRPEKMKPIGFGLCAFAAIHIPESER